MELLYSYKNAWFGVSVEVNATALIYESGFAYMKNRETVPLKGIASITASSLLPSVAVKTVDGRELKISVGSAGERDKFYAALQDALGKRE
jgi:hypothetical protein